MQFEFYYLYIIFRNTIFYRIKYVCATTWVTKKFYTIIVIFVSHVVNFVYAKLGM